MNTSVPPEQAIQAAATLTRSSAVGTIVKWVLAVVVPAILSWTAAKLDTSKDITALRSSVQELTTQQAALVKRIDEAVPQLQSKIIGVERDAVIATGTALAYESAKTQRAKLSAGEDLAKSFDGRIARAIDPALAASDVIRNVAVPNK